MDIRPYSDLVLNGDFLQEVLSAWEEDLERLLDDEGVLPADGGDPGEEAVRTFVREWLPKRFGFVAREMDEIPVPFHVRRVITVGEGDVGRFRPGVRMDVGRFWSDERCEELLGHWGDPYHPHELLIEATVTPEEVDWAETLRARMNHVTGDDEREITLREGVEVMIEAVEDRLSPVPEARTGTG